MHNISEPIFTSGFPLGSSAGLVTAFEWLGQPYRLTRVDMLGEMRTDAYERFNGRVETPALVTDEGHVLTETMAIALWLEARDHERRISFAPGTFEADRMHQIIAFLNTGFTGAFFSMWVALEAEDATEAYRETLRALGREFVAKRHKQLEAMMGEGDYLLGDRPTLADAVFVGVARWVDFHEAIDPKDYERNYPRISALRKRIEADPAFRFALAIEDGVPAVGSGAMKGLVPLNDVLKRAGALDA
ncbi:MULTISPECIES: glutathione S-transferase family protein [unclassified Ensifer]|uniref:glutathione S-transferase family protein n=1 Tax=unclassified Ensifer TaxID=2633371 RepID=UPI000813A208|nr:MULTISPECIES: glutathione S-transferase family protein [unclassified Ensifer]OCP00466.1 glutathione S-transferase [Ensifer sp. LC14]OCP05839.1 glutathione S-transferase [Ensifer sp. LC11]OCP06585.1 glutathione S-transferase [Ensifer sp. LC13]OCP31175.1 glutathione S-transferase [Ensifer sp. LC499]